MARGFRAGGSHAREHAGALSHAPENRSFKREIRQLLYDQYRILFTIRGRTVRVLHVRHGARIPLGKRGGE
jgi:plasmid stabilization system protein ParE